MATPSPIELQQPLGGIDYHARRDELVQHARDHGAGEDLVTRLSQIPDREYDGPNAVSAEFADVAT